MKRIVIAGGTGFLGSLLSKHYAEGGYEVVVLSRSPLPAQGNIRFVQWDGRSPHDWTEEIDGAEVVINLTGKSVDCRYNKANKADILNSRVNATLVICQAIKQAKKKPELWVNASSATIYAHTEEGPGNDELNGRIGEGFSVEVCQKWERAFFNCNASIRQVALRTSFVLDNTGGALPTLSRIARSGFGLQQGNGKQYVSWIHSTDFIRIIDWVMANAGAKGIYNCTAPTPLPDKDFMASLQKALGIRIALPISQALLRLGALLLGTETELILKSRKVIPKRLQDEGFQFCFPRIEDAFKELFTKTERR